MMINDDFGANVARLEMTLKTTQVEVGKEENIEEEISVPEVEEEPKSNAASPHSDVSSTDQA